MGKNTQTETLKNTTDRLKRTAPEVVEKQRDAQAETVAAFLATPEEKDVVSEGEWKNLAKQTLVPLPLSTTLLFGAQKELAVITYARLTKMQQDLEAKFTTVERQAMAKKMLENIVTTGKVTETDVAIFKFQGATEAEKLEQAQLALQTLEEKNDDLRIPLIANIAVYLSQRAEFLNKYGKQTARESIPDFLLPYLPLTEKEKGLLKYTAMVLPMQHTVAKSVIGESAKVSDIASDADFLMTIALQKHLSVASALAFADPNQSKDDAVNRFLEECGYKDKKEDKVFTDAAKLILGYIGKHAVSIRAAAQLESLPVEKLTIAEALELTGKESMVMKFAGKFIQFDGSLSIESIETLIKDSLDDVAQKNDVSMQQVLFLASKHATAKADSPVAASDAIKKLKPAEQEQYAVDTEKVAGFMLNAQNAKIKISRLDEYLGQPAIKSGQDSKEGAIDLNLVHILSADQKSMVRNICADVRTQKTYELCVQSLQDKPNGMLETASGFAVDSLIGSVNTKTAEALKAIILEGNISMKDSFELYYILHSTESSGVGGFPLTLKVLSLLKNNGYASLAGEWKSVIFTDLVNAGLSSNTNMLSILKQYGLNDQQLAEMKDVVLTLKEKGFSQAEGWMTKTIRAWAKAPVFGSIIALVSAAGATRIGLKGMPIATDLWYVRTLMGLKRLAYAEDLSPIAKTLSIPLEQVQEFQKKVKAMFEDSKKFTINIPARVRRIRLGEAFRSNLGKPLDRLAQSLYSKPSKNLGVNTLQRLKGAFGLNYYTDINDVTRHLLQFEPNDDVAVKKALQSVGLSEADAQKSIDSVRGKSDSVPASTAVGTSSDLRLPEAEVAPTLTADDLLLLKSETLADSDIQRIARKLDITLQTDGKAKSAADLKAAIQAKIRRK